MPHPKRTLGPLTWISVLLPVPIVVWLLATLCFFEQIPEERDYTIEQITDGTQLDPQTLGKQVWVRILADGRWLGRDEVQRSGPWTVHYGDQPVMFALEQEGPASLRFRARRATLSLLHHPRSGGVRVSRGSESTTISLYSSSSSWVRVTPFHSALWRFAAGLIGALLLLGLIQPWRTGRGLIWLVVTLATVHLSYWMTVSIGIQNDSPAYPHAVEGLVAGHPTYFPVGYGLFCELAGMLPGLSLGHAITLVQHVVIIAVIAFVYVHARCIVDRSWAMLACFLAGAAPSVVVTAQAVISETWTCCLLVLSTTLALAAPRVAGLRLTLAGLLTAWAVLSRVVPIATLGPVLILATMFPWARRSWRRCILALGAAALPVLLVVANCGLRSGTWNLSTSTGHHLFNHFVYEQKLLDLEGPATGLMIRTIKRDPRELSHWEVEKAVGIGWIDDDVFMRVALESAMTTGLLSHLSFNLGLTWRNFTGNSFDFVPFGNETDDYTGELAGVALWNRYVVVEAIRAPTHVWVRVWPWMVVAFLLALPATLLVPPEHRKLWIGWFWVPWSYLFATSSVEYELGRYNTAIVPLVVIQTVLVIGLIANAWRRRSRHA